MKTLYQGKHKTQYYSLGLFDKETGDFPDISNHEYNLEISEQRSIFEKHGIVVFVNSDITINIKIYAGDLVPSNMFLIGRGIISVGNDGICIGDTLFPIDRLDFFLIQSGEILVSVYAETEELLSTTQITFVIDLNTSNDYSKSTYFEEKISFTDEFKAEKDQDTLVKVNDQEYNITTSGGDELVIRLPKF